MAYNGTVIIRNPEYFQYSLHAGEHRYSENALYKDVFRMLENFLNRGPQVTKYISIDIFMLPKNVRYIVYLYIYRIDIST
jgi:hypothetical protein